MTSGAGGTSEWLKVMLDEIARKAAEAQETRAELDRRRLEQGKGLSSRGETPRGRPPPQ